MMNNWRPTLALAILLSLLSALIVSAPAAANDDFQAAPAVTITPLRGAAGTLVQVSASGFPPNARLDLGMGKVDTAYSVVASGTTDAHGSLATQMPIPSYANTGELWVVVAALAEAPRVKAISNAFAVTDPAAGGSATYTVQPGDNLSRIAQRFGTTVEALLAANPGITNPRLIFAGQQLFISGQVAGQPTVAISPLRGPPSTPVTVSARGFRPNAPVEIAIGRQGAELQVVEANRMTDANGSFETQLTIPATAEPDALYVARVATRDAPQQSAVSNVFSAVRAEGQPAPATYIVQPGDYMARIARRFGVSLGALLQANPGLANPSLIYAGQVLVIPGGAAQPTTSLPVYLVALGEGQVGCGDALRAVPRTVPETDQPWRQAIEALLALDQAAVNQARLYNALELSTLRLESIDVNPQGTAMVRLAGDLSLGGVCDAPRIEGQLRQTLLQFPAIRQVEITVNGQPLSTVLSGQG